MTAIHFSGQTYEFGQANQSQVPQGSIVKVDYPDPENPGFIDYSRLYEVRTVQNGLPYGQPLEAITGVNSFGDRAKTFEVVG